MFTPGDGAIPFGSSWKYLVTSTDQGAAWRPDGRQYTNAWVQERFWATAATSTDQLRKRVAFALHHIFMVSLADSNLWSHQRAYAQYLDTLNRHAFGNYRNLLEDISLSPVMGIYLSHMRNRKEDPATGRVPDENFAREVMQLFSIGLHELEPDGTLKLDAQGGAIETYNNDDVMALAKIFTGWSWAFPDNQLTESKFRWGWPDYQAANDTRIDLKNMRSYPGQFSTAAVTLFAGKPHAVNIPAGGSAESRLKLALDALHRHPNVGPFIGRQLIQRLVTSNPSPGYVYRCAEAFRDNGSGVRGDMKAVLRAILLDYEARSLEAAGKQGFGKLKEPDLRLSSILRSLGILAPSDGIYRIWNLESVEWALDQNPLRSPTVFNFFSKDYSLPGAISNAGLYSPEFQIANETTAISGSNYLRWAIWDGVYNNQTDQSLYPAVDWQGFADSITGGGGPALGTPAADVAFVNRLSLLLTANAMSKDADADHTNDMYTILIDAAAGMRQTNPTVYWPPIDADCNTVTPGCAEIQHLKELVWLVMTSPEGVVQR